MSAAAGVYIMALLLLVLIPALGWAFRNLPKARWQMLAAVPSAQRPDGSWDGFNLTYYGFFSATAYALASLVFLLLTVSAGIPPSIAMLALGGLLAIGVPAARIINRMVEGKPNGFTVGGAVFVAILAAPVVVLIVARLSPGLKIAPLLAAMAIAYAVGEGLGRLACLSFGCCYGRPVSTLPTAWQSFARRWAVRFTGDTKKISYAEGSTDVPVVPVQSMTVVLFLLVALAGGWLYARGDYPLASTIVVTMTQGWRVLSEFLRADFRGGGRFSAYQWMALAGGIYAFAVVLLVGWGTHTPAPDWRAGLGALWNPGVILGVQWLWLFIFLRTGVSRVTGARILFHVHTART